MSINPLNDISRVYLEQVATQEVEIDEGMSLKDFKANRRKLKRKEASADAKKRGHVGKEWYNSGRTYSPDEAKSNRAKLDDEERRTRHRSAVDPEAEDDLYSADKTKNPKKLRKQKAMGESAVPGKPAERLGAVTAIPKSEQDAARERILAKTKAKREAMKSEALDPVGQEDSDIDNDGDTDKSDKYLHKRRKAIGKAIAKKNVKEGYSNWRQDLSEVMDDVEASKKIKEKKVNNKIRINPTIEESVEEIGGTLLEMVEIDEFDFILESAYNELLEEGYGEDEVEDALEYALTEAKVTFGHDTASKPEKKKASLLAVARTKLSGAKTAAKAAVARGARKVAKGALGVARKMEGGKGAPKTAERKPSTYRGAGAGTKERVSSGSYTPPTKKKAEKPADPWEGTATTPPKAKAKKAATPKKSVAPKAKAPASPKRKRKSKLDDLLASVRSESVQIDEKTLTKMEMKKREEIVKSMKDKASDFEKRYPGRGKEVMYATATKMAKKVAEQMVPTEKPVDTAIDKKKEMMDKQKLSNLKMLQQKKQQLDRQRLQMQKSGKLPLEAN